MPAYLIPSGHPKYYLQRASTNGRHLCAWFCGRVATRFSIKGCFDPESNGIAIRRAFGAVCRNRHDVARSTQSRHAARNHPVRRDHWLLLCSVSVFPISSSYASEQ
jgi:hypothetical protein